MPKGYSKKTGLPFTPRPRGTSSWNKGLKTPEETRTKLSLAGKGKSKSEETRNKMSLYQRNRPKPWMKGEKNINWKGGISKIKKTERNLIMQTLEYKIWRRSVFERDKWTCIWCGYRSHKRINGRSDIEADHIKPFALYPELRFAIDNGRTLCRPCHLKTDTWGLRGNFNSG